MLIFNTSVSPFNQQIYPIAAAREWCPVLKHALYRNAFLSCTLS
jgi:hypothetical protein